MAKRRPGNFQLGSSFNILDQIVCTVHAYIIMSLPVSFAILRMHAVVHICEAQTKYVRFLLHAREKQFR